MQSHRESALVLAKAPVPRPCSHALPSEGSDELPGTEAVSSRQKDGKKHAHWSHQKAKLSLMEQRGGRPLPPKSSRE